MAHDKREREVNCYEAMKDGRLIIYLEGPIGETLEVTIPAHDVSRLMYGAIDALEGKASRR